MGAISSIFHSLAHKVGFGWWDCRGIVKYEPSQSVYRAKPSQYGVACNICNKSKWFKNKKQTTKIKK